MKKLILIIVFILIGYMFYTGHGFTSLTGLSAPTIKPEAIRLTMADNFTVTGESLQGKVVLFFFWATYCPACREAMPYVKDIYRSYANQNFMLFAVSSKGDYNAAQYSTLNAFPFPNAVSDGELERALGGVRSIPFFALMDGNGNIVYSESGFNPITMNQLAMEIGKALGK